MRKGSRLVAGFALLSAFAVLLISKTSAPGQTPPAPLGQPCNLLTDFIPPDKAGVALIPIDSSTKDRILNSGLPCQENVSPNGPDNTKTALENRQRSFDFYSWLTFLALNSPADGRGIEQSTPDAKAKWEDTRNFKQLLDIMLPEGKASKWEDPKVIPAACQSQFKPGMLVTEMIEESFNQPFKTGPLIDQQGNYAIFDILMNKPMFDYIQQHGLQSKAQQMSERNADLKVDFPAGINPPAGETAGGDPGGIIIKVSWKVIDPVKDKDRFHTADALVLMPRAHDQKSDPPCLHKTLGLVGFHVMHKTVSRLQWIWTSFEHIDNVPEQTDVDKGQLKPSYNFYDPACKGAQCPAVNKTPPRPWDPTPANGLQFHSGYKSQIVREVPLTDATKKMNAQFQNILGNTVWKNYMLLSTQWPSAFPCSKQTVKTPPDPNLLPDTDLQKEPDMTCAPAPTYLANSTLETYSQGEIPLASSSCMACHGNAASYQQLPPNSARTRQLFNQTDFTFILEKAR